MLLRNIMTNRIRIYTVCHTGIIHENSYFENQEKKQLKLKTGKNKNIIISIGDDIFK
jgi:hypothetical protein